MEVLFFGDLVSYLQGEMKDVSKVFPSSTFY